VLTDDERRHGAQLLFDAERQKLGETRQSPTLLSGGRRQARRQLSAPPPTRQQVCDELSNIAIPTGKRRSSIASQPIPISPCFAGRFLLC